MTLTAIDHRLPASAAQPGFDIGCHHFGWHHRRTAAPL